MRACIPGSYGTVTIGETVLGRLPPHSLSDYQQVGGMSQSWRSPHEKKGVWAQACGIGTRKGTLSNIWLRKVAGLTAGKAKGLQDTKVVLFESRCTGSSLKAPGCYEKVTHWLILGCVLEGQGPVGTFARDISTGRHYLKIFLTSS